MSAGTRAPTSTRRLPGDDHRRRRTRPRASTASDHGTVRANDSSVRPTGTVSTCVLGRLGRLLALVGQAGGPGEQRVAQLLRVVLAQVGEQRDRRSRAAGHLEPQLGQPEEPGEQRPDDVDGLQPVEPGLALLPEEHAGASCSVVGVDPVRRALRQDEAAVDAADAGTPPPRRRARRAPRRARACRSPEQLVAALLRHHGDERRDDLPAAHAAASAGAAGATRRPRPSAARRWTSGLGHRPASRGLAAARPAGRAAGRPRRAPGRGSRRRWPGDAVCSCTGARPNRRSSGPACDVDVLHAAVGHDDELRQQHAARARAGRRRARRSPIARTCRPTSHQAQASADQPAPRAAPTTQAARRSGRRPRRPRWRRPPAAPAQQQRPAHVASRGETRCQVTSSRGRRAPRLDPGARAGGRRLARREPGRLGP